MKKNQRQIPFYNELPYLDYGQIFTVSSIMYDTEKGKEISTFDVTIREMPGKRNFMLLAGIEEAVNTVLNWRYEKDFIDYLLKDGYISDKFAEYLRDFKFEYDLWAAPEGTVVFPGEPVIRITAPLAVANLFTGFLANVISYPTLFLTKVARVRLAAGEKMFCTAGAMRALGFENILKLQRLSYVGGSIAIIPFAKYHFGIDQGRPAIGFYHAVVKSFDDEKSAYRHFLPYVKNFGLSSSMVDTYNIETGIDNWIEVEKEARQAGVSLGMVSIDSGDVYDVSVFLRGKLDQAGLNDTKILAYSNLNEFKILELEKKGAKVDAYVAITEVIDVSDRPVLEAVYKLAETINKDGEVSYAAKLTPGKLSLPGRKQIFRNYTKDGKIDHDIIGLENEELGLPILVNYIERGKLTEKLPSLDDIKEYINVQLNTLPDHIKELDKESVYNVFVSEKLKSILEDLKNKHIKIK